MKTYLKYLFFCELCAMFFMVVVDVMVRNSVGEGISIVGYSIAALFMFGIVSLVALGIKLFA